MGNCQASEAATVVIIHPGGNKMERIYRSVTVRHVMNSNPGHYVALVVTLNGLAVKKQLKLLRPHDLLLLGQVYQLICFQDVMKEFTAKKCVKPGKLLKEKGVIVTEAKETNTPSFKSHKVHPNGNNETRSKNKSKVKGRQHLKHQWKPSLKSISENEN